MCTVTFIPHKGKVFITSNRDEKRGRAIAIPPQAYDFNSGKIFFPKDGTAGGSWFAVHENGNVIVLLNGGFKYHDSKPPYRKSRGLILVELIEHETPFNFFRSITLDDIEPFTLVIWEDESLFECRWDGEKKYAKHLDKAVPHIWSSATLYNDEVSAKRKKWFEEWLVDKKEFSQQEVLHFHQFTGDGDIYNDLTMNRDGEVFTVSITGVEISDTRTTLMYLDLLNNKTYLQPIELNKEWAAR